jgi:hypothetical protein
MPIAIRDPTKTPNTSDATDRVAKHISEQDRALRRLFGPNPSEYFRQYEQLRRAALTLDRSILANWSAAARAANLGMNARFLDAVADRQRRALEPGITGAVGALAAANGTLKLGSPVSGALAAGITRWGLDARRQQAGCGAFSIGARLAADTGAHRKLIGDDIARSVARVSGIASVSARASLLAATTASALTITAEVGKLQRLTLEQNNALLGMSITGDLVARLSISSIAALDAHTLATSALLGTAVTRGIAEQMRGVERLIGGSSVLSTATALRRSLLATELASMSITRSILAKPLTIPSIATAFNFPNTALGTFLDGLAALGRHDWRLDDPPAWEEIYGLALRELRAELSGQSLGYTVQVHVALLVLEAILTASPALPVTVRDKVHEGFLVAHALALAREGYRRALR